MINKGYLLKSLLVLATVICFESSAFCGTGSTFSFIPIKGVIPETYADNLFASFTDIPILDTESASLQKYEEQPFTLKKELKDLTLNYTVPAKIGGIFPINIYDGLQRKIVSAAIDYRIDKLSYTHTHPYHRLEEMRQLFMSFKPEPEALYKMRVVEGTTLYPNTIDISRNFENNTATSENRKLDYSGGEQRPGIRQILFFNKDNYQTPDQFPVKLFRVDLMKDYRSSDEHAKHKDDRDPLKIAAWFEKKLLMPFGAPKEEITWKTKVTEWEDQVKGETEKEITLKGGEDVGNDILQSRRESFLQEAILEAINTTAYVQLKSIKALDFLGKPNAEIIPTESGVSKPGDASFNNDGNLLKALLGEGVAFEKKDGKFRFTGDFMSGEKGASTDINGDIKINFIARHTFSQLLSVYHQIQAARLKLLVAGSIYNSPKVMGDDSGIGPVRELYNADKKERESIN